MRESTQSWREVLLGMKQRGFTRPAKLAVGDGALGFWAALSQVYPTTRTQRCWMHKTGNVLNYLPKSGQAKAKRLHEIWMAETKAPSRRGLERSTSAIAWLATATNCSRSTTSPAHWASNPNVIESAFAIRHRSSRACASPARPWMIYKMGPRRNPGAGSADSAELAKLIEGVKPNRAHRGQ